MPIGQMVSRSSMSHLPPCQRHYAIYPVCKVLSCQSGALLLDDTVEGLDCSSLTLGEACVVTCADGYTAAGDTETTLTCAFNPELQSL